MTKSKDARKKTQLYLYEGDVKVLDWITDYMGCSQAEAIRTAIRFYAGSLAEIERRKKPRERT